MFVRRKTIDALFIRIERLEHKELKHGKGIGKLYEKFGSAEKNIENLQEQVGTRRSYLGFDIDPMEIFYGPYYTTKREAKSFNLTEKINAIMDHLGLQEKVSADTKLIKKPVTNKKGKK